MGPGEGMAWGWCLKVLHGVRCLVTNGALSRSDTILKRIGGSPFPVPLR